MYICLGIQLCALGELSRGEYMQTPHQLKFIIRMLSCVCKFVCAACHPSGHGTGPTASCLIVYIYPKREL